VDPTHVAEIRFFGLEPAAEQLLIVRKLLMSALSTFLPDDYELHVHEFKEDRVEWKTRLSDDMPSDKQKWFARKKFGDLRNALRECQHKNITEPEVKRGETLMEIASEEIRQPTGRRRTSEIIDAMIDAETDLLYFLKG